MRSIGRAAVYTAWGFAFEVCFSAIHDRVRGRPIRFRTSPWMLPVYALTRPLFEPIHDRVRHRPLPLRAGLYGIGFLGVEYTTGRIFRRVLGEAPWDYSYARVHIDGLIRPDYVFLWAIAGLALEQLHDRLTVPDRS